MLKRHRHHCRPSSSRRREEAEGKGKKEIHLVTSVATDGQNGIHLLTSVATELLIQAAAQGFDALAIDAEHFVTLVVIGKLGFALD